MARKNDYGKYILSAGEIASYTVCPEAWRLKTVEKANSIYIDNIKKGRELHEEWSADFDAAIYFTKGTKLILLLISMAILIFLVTFK